jgi:hypothetical protein
MTVRALFFPSLSFSLTFLKKNSLCKYGQFPNTLSLVLAFSANNAHLPTGKGDVALFIQICFNLCFRVFQVFVLKKEKKAVPTTYPQVTSTGSQESEEIEAAK